jgi:hypothetical protein
MRNWTLALFRLDPSHVGPAFKPHDYWHVKSAPHRSDPRKGCARFYIAISIPLFLKYLKVSKRGRRVVRRCECLVEAALNPPLLDGNGVASSLQVVARSLLPKARASEWCARSSNVRSGRTTFYERDQRLRPLVVGVFGGKRLHCKLALHGIRASYRRV